MAPAHASMRPRRRRVRLRGGGALRAAVAAALMAAAAAAAPGCTREITETIGEALGEDQLKGPVGIGTHQDELKLSPCACAGVGVELGRPPWAS